MGLSRRTRPSGLQTPSAPGRNVKGIAITGAGTTTQAICSLSGRNATLDGMLGSESLLGGLVSTGADVGRLLKRTDGD